MIFGYKIDKKKINYIIISIAVFVLLLLAGIAALTQELDYIFPSLNEEDYAIFERGPEEDKPPEDPIKHTRWFRSNAGGMAIEEVGSRFVAMRNEFALAIDFENHSDMPDRIQQYYRGDFTPEVRLLYRNGRLLRTQWIFRDRNGTTRVNAVFIEPKEEEPEEPPRREQEREQIAEGGEAEDGDAEDGEQIADNGEEAAETVAAPVRERRTLRDLFTRNRDTNNTGQTADNEQLAESDAENDNEELAEGQDDDDQSAIAAEQPDPEEQKTERKVQVTGFLEIFDEKSFLTSEIRYFEDGRNSKIDYVSNNNQIISATVYDWDDDFNDFTIAFTDYYRYNRSLSLRAVERVFYKDRQMTDDFALITFPRRIMDAVEESLFTTQRFNLYPDFFGDMFAHNALRMVYQSDERGRITSQTLYDDDEKVIWVIRNTWLNDRITATVKTEGDIVLRAEYTYASNGDRLVERNLRNGVLERVVRTQNNTEIEELYFNNVLVLQAVWEDGRKISETRMR